MEINKKALVLGIIGIFIVVVSTIRWYFIYYDLSQAIIGVAIGGLVLFFAYIYNWMINIDKVVKKMEIKIGGFDKHFMEKKFR